MTISAPRIATPGIAPALPCTTTEPVYMLSPTPQPNVVVHLESGRVGEAGAEVAGGATDADVDRMDQPDPEMVAGIRIDELYVLAVRAVPTDALVSRPDPGVG